MISLELKQHFDNPCLCNITSINIIGYSEKISSACDMQRRTSKLF